MADLFEKRLRRAEVLEKEWPFSAGILRFFHAVTAFQKGFLENPRPVDTAFGDLLELMRREGPSALADAAKRFQAADRASWDSLLTDAADGSLPPDLEPELVFFSTLILQPVAMMEAPKVPQEPSWDPGGAAADCTRCGRPPIVSVLREDKAAETVRRSLVCSYCALEWEFPRVLCPVCREEKPEKLPRYTAQEIPWMRVEACDTCKKYIKCVDLTLNWDAEPIVDELASTPLDVIAREHGYTKIAPNLAGI